MEEKNNSLIVVTKSIFDKIKNFFRNIFNKKVIAPSEESNKAEDINAISEKVEEEIEADLEDDKKEFFKKYKEFKEGKINASDFTGAEKVKLNSILDEELNINSKKLEQIQKIVNIKENLVFMLDFLYFLLKI